MIIMDLETLKKEIKNEYNAFSVEEIKEVNGNVYAKILIPKPLLVEMFSTDSFDEYWIKRGDSTLYNINNQEILKKMEK